MDGSVEEKFYAPGYGEFRARVAASDELYQVARRLDERMDTVERLVAADNPDFKPARVMADRETDNVSLDELDRLRSTTERNGR